MSKHRAKYKAQSTNKPEALQIEELTEVLNAVIDERAAAVMTYPSKGKWHTTKVVLTELSRKSLMVEVISRTAMQSMETQIDQRVGISFEHGYDKFILESVVAGFEASVKTGARGKIVLELPGRAEKVQRRNFFRVPVPKRMKVNTLFWHQRHHDEPIETPAENYWQGRLVEVSAGGMQIAVSEQRRPSFKAGQFVGLQFTPMPYEKPLLLEGRIRRIAESTDRQRLYLGLQIIGLEASPEGRQQLRRLCSVIESYSHINKTNKNRTALTVR